MKNRIEFACWEDSAPLAVSLEPEGFEFTVNNKNDVLKYHGSGHSISLYPEPTSSYSIKIYLNEVLKLET